MHSIEFASIIIAAAIIAVRIIIIFPYEQYDETANG